MLSRFITLLTQPRPADRQAGYGLGSMLAALAILTLLAQGTSHLVARYRATPVVNEAAAHLEHVAIAAAAYIRDNHASLTSTLPLNGAATTITQATLRDAGYLSPQLALANPYGQTASVRVRYITQGTGGNSRNVLEPLVVTQGGREIIDHELLRIAGKIQAGGTIRSNAADVAIGNSGGWEVPLASFGGSPGAGHLAVGMFVSDAGMFEDYLYRSSIPGRPEVNQMNTAIDMQGNALEDASVVETGEAHLTRVVAEASACSPDGALARNGAGDPMVCKGATWRQSANFEWVAGQGQRLQMTAANGQAMWLQNINGRMRWVNSAWNQELASIDQQGNVRATGRLSTGEYLQIDGTATEGGNCNPDGLVGRTTDGLILSCQSGMWRAPQKTFIQNGKAHTSNCPTYWMDSAQRICQSSPYVDIFFSEPMPVVPTILAVAESLFPYTPCAQGASDAVDHLILNVTRFGFRLYGGASPTQFGTCGVASSGRAVSLYGWIAISQS